VVGVVDGERRDAVAPCLVRQRVGADLQRQGREPELRIHVEHAGRAIGELRHRAGVHVGVLQRLHVEGDAEQPVGDAPVALGRDHGVGHRAGLVVGEATGREGAEGEGVGLVEAQVNGVGHGASGRWKRSGMGY